MVAVTAIAVTAPFINSCRHELIFGELVVCGEVNETTFKPAGIEENFGIDEPEVFAVIEVSGVRGGDGWKFAWINEDTGEVIAESSNKYSDSGSSYVEGYLSNRLTPAEETGVIGEPGSYSVNFYHNDSLISSACFTIEQPMAEITEVLLSSEINGDSKPADSAKVFYPEDAIYTLVELDFQIEGETVGVKWYKDEDELLGEEEVDIKEDYYLPGFIVFEMVDDEPWPVGDYHADVYHNGIMVEECDFEILKSEIPDAAFNENNIYEKEDYKFSIVYPDGWVYEEMESSRGLDINFAPSFEDTDIPVEIKVMVLKEGYYPSPEEYLNFSENILAEVIDADDSMEIESGEHKREIDGVECSCIDYSYTKKDNGGWDVELIFIEKGDMLYLVMKISDIYYREFAYSLFEDMLDLISFD